MMTIDTQFKAFSRDVIKLLLIKKNYAAICKKLFFLLFSNFKHSNLLFFFNTSKHVCDIVILPGTTLAITAENNSCA